ncbi:hypothetical protein G647_00554 [Cladophialophora carrionii CBS 160.54]|uniref:Xylanolytic transcriptional activator regulatory domain-containing protein n=1 Tax=Cladophialophora carrionii CBS 160.54 TaxID=1279043 RepID=V9DMK6_9EURO|nr:uncharacterized protein G647_00554 [Cladophialophora carrionii CBS 160.54]ETI28105.1 hypothetical protein G647_00554 [Cladophialophora carrionii CBS 160.54]
MWREEFAIRPVPSNPIGLQEQHGYDGRDSSSPLAPQRRMGREPHDFSGFAPVSPQAQYDRLANPPPHAPSAPHYLDAGTLGLQPSYGIQDAALYGSVGENATTPAANWTTKALSTINWLQADMTSFSDDDLNNLFGFLSGDFSFSPSIDLVSPAQQHDVEIPANDLLSNIVAQQNPPQVVDRVNFQQTSPNPDSSDVVDKSTVESGEYYVDGDAGRLPRSKRRKIGSRPRFLEHVEDLEFSLEYRFPITPCPDSRLTLSDGVHDMLCTLHRQLCLETTLFKPFLPSEFPTRPALEGLLFNYFSQFDPTMPFLHFPTFKVESGPCVLLLAMMALGSCFVDSDETEIFTLSMHELVRRYLIVRNERKDWSPENPQTLAQVHLLHAVGAGYTQVEGLHASASSSLYQATKFCRDSWAPQEPANDPGRRHHNAFPEWIAWVKNEEVIRTGFCIWLLDCMWAFQFQQPPHLSLDHATAVQLPCPESAWSAKDVPSWNQLAASGITGTPTLLEALRNLYIDKRHLPNLGEFSRILLIHGLIHRTREVEATVTQSLSKLEPSAQKQASHDIEPRSPVWPPSVPLFNRWRNSACDCLDILHWRANETIGAACGMEHPTVLHLHLARVILLAPMRDIILFSHHLIRSSKDAIRLFPCVSSAEAEEHCRLIQRWALQDQYKARLAAIHAGVLFWHVRLYSVNGFYEPTAVAFAALLLWALGAFSTKKPVQSGKPGPRARSGGTSFPSEPSSPSPDVCDIILIDRPTDDELVQQFVRQGDYMHANLTGVGDLFGPKGPRKVLAEGQKLLSTLRGWRGLTGYWIGVLSRLEKATAKFGVDSNPAGAEVTAPAV